MSIPTQDPKGYYRILGLALDADETAIKQAYRRKAFELHPDRNPSPNAVAEFQRINDAYHTLSDPRSRALYATLTTARPAPPPASTATSAARPAAASGPRACSSCGQVTAQPRYIIFEKVTGRLWRTERTPISGVFCRRCAERLGFAASLHCWLKGWWAFPLGPPHTLSALWVNLRGGVKPDRENSALLLQQARAFLGRGDRSLAHGLATQALALAPAEGRDRDNAERMLNALGAEPGRRLRNVWMGPGIGFWLQLLPPAGLGLVFALVALPWLREPPPTAPGLPALSPPPAPLARDGATGALPSGRVHTVVAPTVALRTGPGNHYDAAAIIRRGTFLVVLDVDPRQVWARAMTAQGLIGFVRLDLLRPVGVTGAHAPLADEAEPTSAPLAPPTASPSAAPAPLTPRSADPRPSADDRE